jgi:3-dehydroquinate dehydratase type I
MEEKMRPKICVPIVASLRDTICEQAKKAAALPIQMAEWRVDFFAGYEREIESVVEELKEILGKKELIVTLRTESEGGEANGSRFDYFSLIRKIRKQGIADYVDVEIMRDEDKLTQIISETAGSKTNIIGSYHDFEKTEKETFIQNMLLKAKELGCDVAKFACMPKEDSDVERLLLATAMTKEMHPELPVITMSMGEMGVRSRLYGGLYGSEVTFASAGQISAPGQISYEKVNSVFNRIYGGRRHIVLIGFMGVGKSTISQALKEQSGWREIDTDAMIVEQERRSIADIFAEEGEEYFRQKETDLIDELADLPPSIISCGGGMAMRDLNVRKLQAIGEVVLLTAQPDTIYERVKDNTDRPLLNGHMNVPYIRELMEKRRPFYEKAATFSVTTDEREPADIAKEILEKCRQII